MAAGGKVEQIKQIEGEEFRLGTFGQTFGLCKFAFSSQTVWRLVAERNSSTTGRKESRQEQVK